MGKRRVRPRNLIAGYSVVIQKHVVDRYVERTGVSRDEAEKTITKKFRNSKLDRIQRDKSEVRHEVSGAMFKRLTFISHFRNGTFYVTTCYVQGSKNDWWKNEGLIIEKELTEEERYLELEKEIDFFAKEMNIGG